MSFDLALFILRLLAAAILYAFLGVLLLMLWRDTAPAPSRAGDDLLPAGRLVVVEGGQTLLEIGKEYPLRRLNTLGRAPTCTIVLPDNFASVEHAHIIHRDGCWWLEDRHSRNGTAVNDVPISEAIVLSAGDVIGIGSIRLRVEFDQDQNTRGQGNEG